MNEAVNLDQTAEMSYRTDDIVLVDVASAPAVDDEDPWTTIALPNAIGAEELEEGDSIDLVDSLTQQNDTLRARVTFLEAALGQSQLTLQQESERWESRVKASEDAWLREQEAVIARYLGDLTQSQQKVTELFQQLERSHQLTQRQQILIDTMNTELRVSQEQVAQLERECATTQQNFAEQVQLVAQAERTCRDLRSRLNRQQRYTLQFKAALEKSLEVPGLFEDPIVDAEPVAPKMVAARVAIPKATPVQPWSAQSGSGNESDWSSKAWVNAFLSDSPEAFPNDEAKTVYLTSETALESHEPVSYVIEEMPASETEMDIDLPSPRLDGWEEPASDIEVEIAPVVSPFITLKHEEGESEGDRIKRESLLAIELPSFGK
ncbi:MAG: hypothetical protein HC860_02545 [Alkalinema sp. RU_4_3]|nr:hypothetical protein [Alkalinema sp. RU_4_3]